MNIESKIKDELWTSIRSSYTSGNYSHSIKDAMSFVTEVLRDKSGLDGDGDSLVGQALGAGKNKKPKLMINRYQTQTEKDEQRGFMFVLKGLYAFIRNPRTHEQTLDTEDVANRIILFIDYLTDFLGASQQSFTIQQFLGLVTDPHFVRDSEYVENLINLIPVRKMTDTLIRLYRNLTWKQADNFEPVIKGIIKEINDSQREDFLTVVSDDLQTTNKTSDITLIIKILPSELWPKLERMPRFRVEQMLVDDLDDAWYSYENQKTNRPSATWINQIAEHYIRKDRLRTTILKALQCDDFDRHNFIGEYFLSRGCLPFIFESESQAKHCIREIASTLRRGNSFMKDCLINHISSWDGFFHRWDEYIIQEISDLTDDDNPERYLSDGTPILGKFSEKQNPSSDMQIDDIPF